jgi:hypothetical protein
MNLTRLAGAGCELLHHRRSGPSFDGACKHRASSFGATLRFSCGRISVVPDQARIVQLLIERVDVQENALEVWIKAEGLVHLVGELRQQGERRAA